MKQGTPQYFPSLAATPANNPPPGLVLTYIKSSDGRLYQKNSAGVESLVNLTLGQQLMANSQGVAIASDQTPFSVNPDVTQTTVPIAMTATSQAVTALCNGRSTAFIDIAGSWTGTLIFEYTVNNIGWQPLFTIDDNAGFISSTATGNGQRRVNISGMYAIRVRCFATGTGPANISINENAGTGVVIIGQPLPAGGNNIGSVNFGDQNSTGSVAMSAITNAQVAFNLAGKTLAHFAISGSWTGTIIFEGSMDNTTYYPLKAITNSGLGVDQSTTTVNGEFKANLGGFIYARARCSVIGTGTATVNINCRAAGTSITIDTPIRMAIDSYRSVVNYFMAAPVISSATETLMSLTGYKANAPVAATTTPAVVSAGKTYRITSFTLSYVAIATAGYIIFRLRLNLSGVGTLTSNLMKEWILGGPAAVAGVVNTVVIEFPEGLDIPAGAGFVISQQGFGATGTAAAVGYGHVTLVGLEYNP